MPLKALLKGQIPAKPIFKEKLGKLLGVDACVLAGSARALIYLVFLDVRSRSDSARNEVLLPGYTCYSLPAAVVKAGLKVSLYDLDPHTLQPDLEDVRRKISSRTLAIVGQHLLGVASDIKSLAGIASQQGVCSVEDSAQLFPGRCGTGDREGGADYTVYSFGRGKPLPLGSGGALISDKGLDLRVLAGQINIHPAEKSRKFVPLAVQVLSRPAVYWFMEKLPLGLGRTVYDPGFKVFRMGLFHQRLGESALDFLEMLNRHRSVISRVYAEQLGHKSVSGSLGSPVPLPHVRYPILAEKQEGAVQMAPYGVRRMYPEALCDLNGLRPWLADQGVRIPGAREVANRLVTLPTHLGVNENSAREIAQKAKKVLGHIASVRPMAPYFKAPLANNPDSHAVETLFTGS